MTINVAVKCPEGVVLGTDGLITLFGANKQVPVAFASRYKKLFQIGALPVGVMLNGDVAIHRGQTFEDIVAEFGEQAGDRAQFDLRELVGELARFVTDKVGTGPRPNVQLIAGGYSRRKRGVRYGEVYTLTWDEDSDAEIESLYATDTDFGYVVGGAPSPVDRFVLGYDRRTVDDFMARWSDLFHQTRDYIFAELERSGHTVPPDKRDIQEPSVMEVTAWSLLSDYTLDPERLPASRESLLTAITKQARWRYRPPFGLFSLPMAINFAWHLLLIAYAESNFTPHLPVVGSELTVATITRDGRFNVVWCEEPNIALRPR
jgi:hypothetical protein